MVNKKENKTERKKERKKERKQKNKKENKKERKFDINGKENTIFNIDYSLPLVTTCSVRACGKMAHISRWHLQITHYTGAATWAKWGVLVTGLPHTMVHSG